MPAGNQFEEVSTSVMVYVTFGNESSSFVFSDIEHIGIKNYGVGVLHSFRSSTDGERFVGDAHSCSSHGAN